MGKGCVDNLNGFENHSCYNALGKYIHQCECMDVSDKLRTLASISGAASRPQSSLVRSPYYSPVKYQLVPSNAILPTLSYPVTCVCFAFSLFVQ